MSRFFIDPSDKDFNAFLGGHSQEEKDRLEKLLGQIGSPDPVMMAKKKVEDWYHDLSDDQQLATQLGAGVGAIAGSFGLIWVNGKLRNLAIRKMWDLYMVPLGLRPITAKEASGVSSLITLASGSLNLAQWSTDKKNQSPTEAIRNTYVRLGRDTAITVAFLALSKFEQMRKK